MSDLGGIKPRLTFLMTGYTFAVGVLYEWGYWGRFDVNILQFMTLTDVVRSFAYPFAAAIFTFMVGVALGSFIPITLPEGGGRETRVGKILNRRPVLILSLFAYVALALKIWWLGGPQRWTVPAAMLTPVLAAMVSRYEVLHGVISNPKLRSLITLVGVGMPVLAFAHGATNAEQVLESVSYFQAKFPNDEAIYKYLGHAGEYIFLLSADNKTVHLRKASDTLPLQLTHVGN